MLTSIRCDSAYFDKVKSLWTLTGNVRMTNVNGDVVLTDELIWDQAMHRMYSDAFIHIEKQGRIIEGYGYESNERLTTYELRQVEAIFPIDESRMPHPGSGNAAPASVQ
jgi:LPS export ABC transporter protein LptC